MAIKDFSLVPVQQTYASYTDTQWHESWNPETYRDVFCYAAKVSSDIPSDVLEHTDAFLHVSASVIPLTTNTDAGDFEECVKLRHKLTLTTEDEYESTYTYTADARPMMYDWAASDVQTTYTSTAWDDMESALANSYDKIGNVECISTSSDSSDYYTYTEPITALFSALTATIYEYQVGVSHNLTLNHIMDTISMASDMLTVPIYDTATFESNGSTFTEIADGQRTMTLTSSVLGIHMTAETHVITRCDSFCDVPSLAVSTYGMLGEEASVVNFSVNTILAPSQHPININSTVHEVSSASINGAVPDYFTSTYSTTNGRGILSISGMFTESTECDTTYTMTSVAYNCSNTEYSISRWGWLTRNYSQTYPAYCSMYRGISSGLDKRDENFSEEYQDNVTDLDMVEGSSTFILTSSAKIQFGSVTETVTYNITTSAADYRTLTHYNTHSLFSFEARRWNGWMPQLSGKL